MLARRRRRRPSGRRIPRPAASGRTRSLVARPLPTETASLGFGGSLVGGGDKNSRVAYFLAFHVGGGITTLRLLCLCRNNSAQGLFQQKKRLSQSGCSAPTNELFPPAHSAFLAPLCGGGITTLGAALHAVETLDARGSRRRIRRFYAGHGVCPCGLNSPRRVHTPPQP